MKAGFATADPKVLEVVRVEDGVLDLGFIRGVDSPKIDGIEIARAN
jgi:hypothetical protein